MDPEWKWQEAVWCGVKNYSDELKCKIGKMNKLGTTVKMFYYFLTIDLRGDLLDEVCKMFT